MKKIMLIIRELLTVSKCPSCHAVVKHVGVLCPECREKYASEKQMECIFCGMSASACVCSTRGLYASRQLDTTMRSLIFYEARNKVFLSALASLKRASDRSAEVFFARELSAEILKIFKNNSEMATEWCVTFPPRGRKAVIDYGFDQSKGLAKKIAAYTGMTFEEVFVRRGSGTQKVLDAEGRKRNAKDSFSLSEKADPRGKKYVIVDDVITSGATMKRCQELLYSAKAKAAFPLSVAKTPRRGAGFDEKVRFRAKKNKTWFAK